MLLTYAKVPLSLSLAATTLHRTNAPLLVQRNGNDWEARAEQNIAPKSSIARPVDGMNWMMVGCGGRWHKKLASYYRATDQNKSRLKLNLD